MTVLTDEEFDRRVDKMLADHPGLFPRHAAMFVQMEDQAIERRAAALEWEREKGQAFAEGMARASTSATPSTVETAGS